MFSRATETRAASCSSTGSSALHGRHHGAQKSTTTGSPAIASSNVAASSSSTRGMVAALQPLGKSGDPKCGNLRHRLEEDRPAHLRHALATVDEDDWHLGYVKALAQGAIRPL